MALILVDVCGSAGPPCEAADALHAQATEVLEVTKRLEVLTEDVPAQYAATRAEVEARATLEQAEELGRAVG